MNNWVAFKELFVCVALVVIIGITIGTLIMRDQYADNVTEKVYATFYEPLQDFEKVKQQPEGRVSGQNRTMP